MPNGVRPRQQAGETERTIGAGDNGRFTCVRLAILVQIQINRASGQPCFARLKYSIAIGVVKDRPFDGCRSLIHNIQSEVLRSDVSDRVGCEDVEGITAKVCGRHIPCDVARDAIDRQSSRLPRRPRDRITIRIKCRCREAVVELIGSSHGHCCSDIERVAGGASNDGTAIIWSRRSDCQNKRLDRRAAFPIIGQNLDTVRSNIIDGRLPVDQPSIGVDRQSGRCRQQRISDCLSIGVNGIGGIAIGCIGRRDDDRNRIEDRSGVLLSQHLSVKVKPGSIWIAEMDRTGGTGLSTA